MVKTVLVFGASISANSVNQQLAEYAGSLLTNSEVKVIRIIDYQCEIYSQDIEAKGIPQIIKDFSAVIQSADGYIVSFAEHNQSYTSAYKNTFDWLSRLHTKNLKGIFGDKPCLFLSCSPSNYGGATVMEHVLKWYNLFGAKIVNNLSVPKSYETLKDGKLVDQSLNNLLQQKVKSFEDSLHANK